MISNIELPRFEQLFAQLNVTKKKENLYYKKAHTKKNQTLKKKGNIEGFAKKTTSTKTRKIESGTSFEVKTHVEPFSTKKININNNLFKNEKKEEGRKQNFLQKNNDHNTDTTTDLSKQLNVTTEKKKQGVLQKKIHKKKTGSLKQKKEEGSVSKFLRKVPIVLTKRLVPITRPFLESQLIFTFLKNLGKLGFKNESKCISRALARLSKKNIIKPICRKIAPHLQLSVKNQL